MHQLQTVDYSSWTIDRGFDQRSWHGNNFWNQIDLFGTRIIVCVSSPISYWDSTVESQYDIGGRISTWSPKTTDFVPLKLIKDNPAGWHTRSLQPVNILCLIGSQFLTVAHLENIAKRSDIWKHEEI